MVAELLREDEVLGSGLAWGHHLIEPLTDRLEPWCRDFYNSIGDLRLFVTKLVPAAPPYLLTPHHRVTPTRTPLKS